MRFVIGNLLDGEGTSSALRCAPMGRFVLVLVLVLERGYSYGLALQLCTSTKRLVSTFNPLRGCNSRSAFRKDCLTRGETCTVPKVVPLSVG